MKHIQRKRIYSADGKQEWTEIWGWVDVAPPLEPLKDGPLLPGAKHHAATCLCGECTTAAAEYATYLKNRKAFNDNGW